MKALPCPRCGSPETIGTFCVSCLRELHPLVVNIKEPSVTFCVESDEVKITSGWERLSPREAIDKSINKSLVFAPESIIDEVIVGDVDISDLLKKPGIDREVIVPVTAHGRALQDVPHSYDEVYDVPLTVKTTISPAYAKIGTQYFEGTFQARNEREKHKKHFYKLANKPGFGVNKDDPQKNGSDYQVTDKQVLKKIVYDLHDKFGGFVKENVRLITRDKQRSRDVYRLTMLLEYPSYEVGDVLADEKKVYVVRRVSKLTRLQDIMTGKNTEQKYEPGKFSPVETFTSEVTQVEPQIGVLHPETFQQVRLFYVGNPEFAVGQTVRLVNIKGRWWFVS